MSIIKMMDRLNQKNCSCFISPQIRYPDCYGIDGKARRISSIGRNSTFKRNLYHIVDEVYKKCKAQENLKDAEVVNLLQKSIRHLAIWKFQTK
jgi:amidophosphoribosyltransferase